MKTADVVIGANWGDEGKGLMTDYLASAHGRDALVVRFCGGAQAGHTVTTPDGRRHVFNHFGSGAFCDSPTYLSRFFICNPILFLAEKARLEKCGVRPQIFIDLSAPVTTPYDMMINQMTEERRGGARHGSCGAGIGETVERQQHVAHRLHFADLYNSSALAAKLERIRKEWVPARLRKLGMTIISSEWAERIQSANLLTHFLRDVQAFVESVSPADFSIMSKAQHVIFEGAQGLLLDQNHAWFPHVTRSNTGLQNVVALAKDAGIDALNVHYMSRCYATRHGAGPMPHELPVKPYEGIVDLTNVPNPHQGTLRFGWLDLDLLQKSILHDLEFAKGTVETQPLLALTCLDQVDDQVHFIAEGEKRTASMDKFLSLAAQLIPSARLLTSSGPTRRTVEVFSPPPHAPTLKMYAGALIYMRTKTSADLFGAEA